MSRLPSDQVLNTETKGISLEENSKLGISQHNSFESSEGLKGSIVSALVICFKPARPTSGLIQISRAKRQAYRGIYSAILVVSGVVALMLIEVILVVTVVVSEVAVDGAAAVTTFVVVAISVPALPVQTEDTSLVVLKSDVAR